MSHSPTETTIERRTVDGTTVDIVRLNWPDGVVGYDVYLVEGGEIGDCLTETESFDHLPTDGDVRLLLAPDPDVWCCPGCHSHVQPSDVRRHTEECDPVDGAGQRIT